MPYECKRCGSPFVKHACSRGSSNLAIKTHFTAAPLISSLSCETAVLQAVESVKQRDDDVHGMHGLLKEHSERKPFRACIAVTQSTPTLQQRAFAQNYNVNTNILCRCCGGAGAVMTHGYRWSDRERRCLRMQGELLCEQCRRSLRDELQEYIPSPPGRPGCYQITRTRHEKRVSLKQGVTLLWVSGRYTEAKALKDTGRASVLRSSVA